jgi:hypothetical protein
MVTCTPPWQVGPWACTSSSATDNNTGSHTAPCLPGNCPSAIETLYYDMGGPSGPLGPVVQAESSDILGYGRYAVYRSGAIYAAWGPGLHALLDPIWSNFKTHDTIAGPLGYPTSDQWSGGSGYAACNAQLFQHGGIYANWISGTHAVWGPCYTTYVGLGSMAGPLYAPVNDTHLAGSVWRTDFSGGSITYDPVTGTVSTTFVLPAGSGPDQRYVTAAYQDFLGRAPSDREMAIAIYALGNAAMSRAALMRTLADTVEWVRRIVTAFYQQTLGRAPDQNGLAYWTQQIVTGRLSVAQVGGAIYSSAEYYTKTGGTLAAWVTDLYQKILHRAPDQNGLAYWVTETQARGRAAVAYAFFQSPESLADRVAGLYEALLDRAPESQQAIDFWSEQILAHGDVELAVQLASSTEYYADAQSSG